MNVDSLKAERLSPPVEVPQIEIEYSDLFLLQQYISNIDPRISYSSGHLVFLSSLKVIKDISSW